MSSSVPIIIISDGDDADDPIVLSDDGDLATTDFAVSPRVEAMRACLRRKCWAFDDDAMSEMERLVKGSGFDCLSELGDGYENAYNKLTILLWVNGVTDAYWTYVVQDAMSRPHTLDDVERLLENQDAPIDAFIVEECITMRLLGAPVPALAEYKYFFLERFRSRFPPVWHRYVMTSDSEIIFGNDLPSYWIRVLEEPRRYY
jgi:hypothetical protein